MEKRHCVFLTQNIKQFKLPRQKIQVSLHVLREDLPCLLCLCYGISEQGSVMLKNKSNVVFDRSQITCVIWTNLQEQHTMLPALQKTRTAMSDRHYQTVFPKHGLKYSFKLQILILNRVIWIIKLGAAAQSLKRRYIHIKNLKVPAQEKP